ncbi:MAG: branched-chain amino acid transporter substrate-binding protein [Chthonomonadaceae bacterium]|nr:branched-chain amino acid transporter substrate-binding protein [Chthonomonadaceae bacterium]
MRSRNALAVLGAAAVTLALAACGGSSSSSASDGGSAKGDLTVGLLAPFTGDYAVYGDGYQQGIDAWIKANGQPQVDGHKVNVVKLDDQCDVAAGVAAFRRQAKKLTAVIGPSCSSIGPPLKPLIKATKVPMLLLGHAASVTLGYKEGWIFRISHPDSANQSAFGEYLLTKWKGQGITKVGVIYDTSVTDANAAKSWTAVSKQVGVSMAASVSFDPGVTDFSSQLLKLKNAGAQGYILQVFGPDESRLIKQMGDLGIKVPIASAEDTPYPFVVNKQTGPGINRVSYYTDYAPGLDTPVSKKFEEAFRQVTSAAPLDIGWEGYLAMEVLMQALKRPGAVGGGDKLREAIAQTSIPLGDVTISFLPNGDQKQVLTYAARIANDKPVLEKLIVKPRESYSDWTP